MSGFEGTKLRFVVNGRRVAVVMPAHKAQTTLVSTAAELDRKIVDEIVLVDDARPVTAVSSFHSK